MALLLLADQLPNLLFGLLAGVWVDRRRRRPLLVGADLGRALLLGSIPAAAFLGRLTFAQLYVVSFLSATLALVYQLANVALLPSLVPRAQLVEANGKLTVSKSLISIAGPGAAGALVQLLSAPKAILVDAVSYLLSGASLVGIRVSEPSQVATKSRPLWGEVAAGVREVVRTPVLLALSLATGVSILGGNVQTSVQLLFLVNILHFSPALIGLIGAADGAAAVLGALVAGRVTRQFGVGPVILLCVAVYETSHLLVPVAGLPSTTVPLLFVVAAGLLSGLSYTIYEVNQVSLRQSITPPSLLGRTTGARRFLIFCAAPLGAAVGGYLGDAIGLRSTLFVGVSISLLSCLVIVFSPVRHVRNLPALTA
jgi:MFS family permease